MRVSLMGSVGWNRRGPMLIQRLAPRMVRLNPGMRTRTSRIMLKPKRRGEIFLRIVIGKKEKKRKEILPIANQRDCILVI